MISFYFGMPADMARGMRKCIIQSQEEYLVEEPIRETSHRPRDAAYDHHPSTRERQKESDNCDTRFAKKRNWGLFFLFFFPHPVVVLGIWNFVENIHN
jgi:hypothetical protein